MQILRNEFVRTTVRPPLTAGKLAALSRLNVGRSIFDEDWDLCIVLDACRVDALAEVAPEYDFLPDTVSAVWSVGGSTLEWLSQTFTTDRRPELADTCYITANAWPQRILEDGARPEDHVGANWAPTDWQTVDDTDFGYLDHAWRAQPTEYSTGDAPHVPPYVVTNRAIRFGRERGFDRYIAHYIQPHSPFAATARRERRSLSPKEANPFGYLHDGGDRSVVWDLYLTDLREALDSIERLLSNFDADEVLITADHWEAFGEYGIHGHRSGSLHPAIRRVPWVRTDAVDRQSSRPSTRQISTTDEDVTEYVEHLGYL